MEKNKTEKAIKLYTNAANKGDAEAMYELGMLYLVGEGTKQDLQLADEWLVKAYLYQPNLVNQMLATLRQIAPQFYSFPLGF